MHTAIREDLLSALTETVKDCKMLSPNFQKMAELRLPTGLRHSTQPYVQHTSFLDLPYEIKLRILQDVMPSGQTFRLKTRDPDSPKAKQPKNDFYGRKPRTVPFPYETSNPSKEEAELGYQQTTFTFLLLHKSITPVTLELASRLNSFSFPDVFTIRSFIANEIGSMCRPYITDMSIDACGLAVMQHGMNHAKYTFSNEPDLQIPGIIKLFPNLKKLVLGGIGPGVRLSEKHLGVFDKYETLMRFCSSVWDIRRLTLIAQIVGSDCLGEADSGSLKDGKITHHVNREAIYTQMYCGELQYLGTTITKKGHCGLAYSAELPCYGQRYRATHETELIDINEAMQKAKEHDENDGRRLRYETAGLNLEKR